MSDRSIVALVRAAGTVGIAFAVIGSAVLTAIGHFDLWLDNFGAFFALVSVFLAVFAWLAVIGQPGNVVVRLMAAIAFLSGFYLMGLAVALLIIDDATLSRVSDVVPADIPTTASWVMVFAVPAGTVAGMGWLTFGLLLFPDGKLPSRRWRWVSWLSGAGLILVAFGLGFAYRPGNTAEAGDNPLADLALRLLLVCGALSALALISRFRLSSGESRQQIKWVVWSGSVMVPVIALVVLGTTGTLIAVVALAVLVAVVTSYGIAVGKYRLYDIDIVISRTFVYGSLAIFIGAVYVGIVVGVGAVFGSEDEPNVWLGIGATVIIAILFQPFRRRMEKLANQMVFGRRATPYEVLSSFSQNVAAVDPDVLKQVARSLTEGTTATAASILVARGEGLLPIASWPIDAPSDGEIEEEVTHEGEPMGVIRLTVPTGQVFTPSDSKLLAQVSSGLGLALKNLQLTDDLRARVDDLRESRRRIVSVQDQTRQKLERDLHDGAQQRLVALKIKIGIGESMAQAAELDDVADVLATVKDEADMTIDSLRTLARGIYPPLLEAEGLGPALSTQLHRQPIPVTVQAAGVGRHPREIESTVYFCVLEAVQNAIRHAQAQSVLVTVEESDGYLVFEVRDDGVGFDVAETAKGPGLTNITDRVDAVEGSVEIRSSPGIGTVIRARVPQRVLESA